MSSTHLRCVGARAWVIETEATVEWVNLGQKTRVDDKIEPYIYFSTPEITPLD